MENQIKNYEQNRKTGEDKQTVIVDNQETGETDELDPLVDHKPENPAVEIDTEDDYFLEEDSSSDPND
jgi:hypothetical protein